MASPVDVLEVRVADMQTVWAALVAAQDHMVVRGVYDSADGDPRELVSEARALVESALSGFDGPPSFRSV